ncbi:MAG: response regulator [Clostridiales bacterium]|jgi:signal transduction histidine kinase/CheY-like chemotaxis protein/transcriptional regulator with GAF, ATPase, and Fis domain|nr:response regulator [Clostridiales bacterium]
MSKNNRQVAMVGALSRAVDILMAHDEKVLEEVLGHGLLPVADAVSLDSVVIYRIYDGPRIERSYRWSISEDGTAHLNNEKIVLPEHPAVDKWLEMASKNIHIDLRYSEASEDEKEFIKIFGIKSLLIIPIIAYGNLWGVVSFQDHKREQEFEGEIDIYRSIARLCASTVIREEEAQKAVEALDVTTRILDGLDAMIYVTKPETGEILFINELMKQHYCINGGKGEVCYKVLQVGCNDRCDFCPCNELDKNPEKVISWEEFSTLTGHYYRNTDRYIDWTDGKKVHIQHSIDITDMKRTQEALEYNQKLTAALNSASIVFLSHGNRPFNDVMSEGVRIILDAVDLDRMSIWRSEIKSDGLHASQIYRWERASGGTTKPRAGYENILYSKYLPQWEKLLLSGETINCPVGLMPEQEAATMKGFGILSAFATPVYIDNNLWGHVLFEDHHAERFFDEKSAEMLRSAAFLCVNAFIRADLKQSLSEAEERMSLMLDSSPLCCQIWDRNMRVLDCNEAAVRLYGLENKQEYLDKFFNFSPEYQPDGERSIAKAMRYLVEAFKDGRCVFDWMHEHPAGKTPLPAEITLVRVKYKDDDVVLGYTRDLREEKIAQQKMQESMARERDLEIQKQAAQASNDAKTRFLANMSHEIRTPMNAIIGMSDLLLSEDLNIRQHRYAEDIRISAISLLDIINNILDISKIQAAKLSLIPVHYSFKTFIDNVCSMTSFLIRDNSFSKKGLALHFNVDISDDIPECLYGDDVRFRQILLNLLSNAIKYTNDGSITLIIRVDGQNMLITVSDTGVGIPEEDLELLFEAFEQADMKKNRNQQGTGLGLTITKSLVELMGGKISVESTYGVGSSFHIVIPFIEGDKTQIKYESGSANIVYAPDADVLVVDDRETNLSVVCGLLTQCHITADTALSGKQAIEMIAEKKYDLVFMDHMMPEMDGIEATKILREKGVKIPIVALTANAVSGAKELMLSAGMDDFLSKPIDKGTLYNVLNHWIPAEKIVPKPETPHVTVTPVAQNENEKVFWEKIHKIKGLSPEYGKVSAQLNEYKNTLEVAMRELAKGNEKLTNFLAEKNMYDFCIEVHGIKGSLSLLGVMGLSKKALKLENASRENDIDFCREHLDEFLSDLNYFVAELTDAFSTFRENQEAIAIPDELPPILNRITEAMSKTDFMAVYNEVDLLNEIEFSESIKDEIDHLKDALLIMNYEHAGEIIKRLMG